MQLWSRILWDTVRTAEKSLLCCVSEWTDLQTIHLFLPPLSCSHDNLMSISIKLNQTTPDLCLLITQQSEALCEGRRQGQDCTHTTLHSTNESASVTASCLPVGSILGVTHSVSIDGKHGLSLWQARRVVDFTDPRLSSAFPQVQTKNTRPVLTNLEWWNRDVMTFSVPTLLSPAPPPPPLTRNTTSLTV